MERDRRISFDAAVFAARRAVRNFVCGYGKLQYNNDVRLCPDSRIGSKSELTGDGAKYGK